MGTSTETSVESKRPLKVDMTSDTLCPFCYIGLRQFQNAVTSFNKKHPERSVDAKIRLLPYQLNPAMPTEPELRSVMYAKKFGKERSEQLAKAMDGRFRGLGIEPPPADAKTSQSHTGQRLLTYALVHHPEKQLSMGEALFDAYHSKGIHPGDLDLLSSVAVDHGVFASKDEAVTWLKGNDFDKEVRQAYSVAQRMGVTGVPFFIFQDKFAASGAIGEEEFESLLEEITKPEGADASKFGS